MIYRRYGKRLMDLVSSALGLVLLAPLLLVIAVAVKSGSRGPVFFCQQRVGRGGALFKMWKFRSMVSGAAGLGPLITASGDSRVTRVGKYLRRSKLDELPQLWNVLCGDMSLVGPRPELPGYVQQYTPVQRNVLLVRPGITDLASLEYCNEEQILAQADNPDQFYRQVILPHKLYLNLEYARLHSLLFDLDLILRTLKVIPRHLRGRRISDMPPETTPIPK